MQTEVVRTKNFHNGAAPKTGTSVQEVNKRINTLRTQYSRLVKPGKSGSCAAAKTERQKWLLTTLSFLEPHVKKRNSFSNFQTTEDDSEEENVTPDEVQEEVENENTQFTTLENPPTPPSVSDNSSCTTENKEQACDIDTPTTTRRQSKKRGRDSIDSVQKAELDLLSSMKAILAKHQEEPEDELSVFGKFIIKQLREINDESMRLMVMNEIQQACFRGRMSGCNSGRSFSFYNQHAPQNQVYPNVEPHPQPSTCTNNGPYQHPAHDNATFINDNFIKHE
ncbi:PREDICTED: uncharacterized protein LOC106807880 isoform X2 [Priapulus caudatus]|uniref:Uncharacterized protein LOC106807880 isoform X2 n=1 Tax=Priapulus caudatus TaxID=37621 RepID=A0ABM1E0Y8_PRICU|nr:PREDICTED: uncharacterized protein LOC106807880 isoform X2 [Priapulus caudatus]